MQEFQPRNSKLICSIATIIERGKASQGSILPHIFAVLGIVCEADTKAKMSVRMWPPCKFSRPTSSRGARTNASKIENNKTQQTTNRILTAIAHMQDASHPIHRVRISYSKFLSPKTCRNIDKSSFKMGHTDDSSPSQMLKRANDDTGSLIRMRAWSSRNCMTSQTGKRRKHALTFPVFPSMKFCKSLYTSWYICLLHNIIFWQNFI